MDRRVLRDEAAVREVLAYWSSRRASYTRAHASEPPTANSQGRAGLWCTAFSSTACVAEERESERERGARVRVRCDMYTSTDEATATGGIKEESIWHI